MSDAVDGSGEVLGSTDSGGSDVSLEVGSDSAVDAGCPAEPAPPGAATCPSMCTGGCKPGNICVIDCAGDAKCNDKTITCPPDYACSVVCKGTDACDTTIIQCASKYACTVACEGTDACGDVDLRCGAGSCTVDCGADACSGMAVRCGAGRCAATCPASGNKPALACGTSCSCSEC